MASPLFVLPPEFEAALLRDPALAGFISDQLARFAPWIKSSGAPLFPGFTDHGPAHLRRVSATCAWLVSEETWSVLSPEDVGCLLLAILLHDSAMHLTPDSLRSLLADKAKPPFPTLDERPWSQLWTDYELETRHWDARAWAQIAGEDFQTRLSPALGQPYKVNLGNPSEAEMPILGEFVRRHHARLAHEFSKRGGTR